MEVLLGMPEIPAEINQRSTVFCVQAGLDVENLRDYGVDGETAADSSTAHGTLSTSPTHRCCANLLE